MFSSTYIAFGVERFFISAVPESENMIPTNLHQCDLENLKVTVTDLLISMLTSIRSFFPLAIGLD